MQTTQQAIAQAVNVQLARMGHSKAWLAGELGMHPASLSNRLAGRTTIDLDDIDRIAAALGMSGFEFFELAAVERGAVA